MSFRPVYLLICGLMLAGIIHIAVILLIPSLGTKDASDQLSKNHELWEFVALSDNLDTAIADIDPFFEIGACRFDLGEEPLLVTGPQTDAYWSASVFNQDGQILYSLNKRTAIENRLRLVVVNPVQMSNLREIQPPEMESAIIVETRSDQGFMVLRVLAPDETWKPGTTEFLKNVKCNRFTVS